MYLAIGVRTVKNKHHSLKVIVPEKTKVNKNRLNRKNNLHYLEFDECDPMHFFDSNTWNVYMEVTPEEHKTRLKE